jgi:arylsulfatase A-like enzyme
MQQAQTERSLLKMRLFVRLQLAFPAFFLSLLVPTQADAAERPNVVWIVVDDMSPNFSCYGETAIQTPHVDRLAAEGVRFTRAYATSPVCSTFRSALITGMYQTATGTHHHRSGRGEHRISLPTGVKPVPELFQEAGYYTCIGSGLLDLDYRSQPFTDRSRGRIGKTDYNFDWKPTMYDANDWSGRRAEQPFFMQVQLHGGKLRGASAAAYAAFGQQVNNVVGEATDYGDVLLPPYYPADRILLQDWALYLDSVRVTDYHVGRVLERLEKEELLENTLIVFFTDHGLSHARGKQFLYDEGTHVPLVIRGPNVQAGRVRTDLVEHIDVAALSLAAAGISVPGWMQGQNILAKDFHPKHAVFAARDRCGEAVDRIRSVRSENYLYIKNFFPSRPHLMPSNYKDSKLIIQRLRELHANEGIGKLGEKLLFSPCRPVEELYLYQQDRWQIHNLAENRKYADELLRHRELLNEWIRRTEDLGAESDDVYVLETEDQLKAMKNETARKKYRTNVETYKRWAREGI